MKSKSLLLAFAALGLAASSSGAAGAVPAARDLVPGARAGQMTAPDAAAPMPTHAADYMKMAGASDLFERQSAKIALQKTRDPHVRSFAQRMVSDHAKTTATLKAAAAKAGLTVPPPMLTPAQQQQIDQLNSASGAAFDPLYLQQQVAAHQQALALHRNYAQSGDKPALKQAASKAVPIVQSHLTMVEKLAR